MMALKTARFLNDVRIRFYELKLCFQITRRWYSDPAALNDRQKFM